ncbi:membrane protein [Paraferrimonas haliotis]|uniref:Membrane protein n=2 Tax=Paraferrimonas haliotis TaxID=2013866 RepID=A0AA37TQ14_9GAMM|nr:membrane protein [Paraferrimonas haliotis]
MLLGLSVSILMLFSGKVAGISGTIAGLLNPKKNDSSWRATFLAGMVLSLFLVKPLGFDLPDVSNNSLALVCFAGLLVGFGTRLGNGCTSGHGIAGLGRFSKRSLAATITFMATAMVVVFIVRHIGG